MLVWRNTFIKKCYPSGMLNYKALINIGFVQKCLNMKNGSINKEGKIVVHVGPGKTGSSALQKWAVENSDYLKNNGIFYPLHNVDENGVSGGNILSVANLTPQNTYEIDNNKINYLLNKFDKSSCSTLLLSSEHFFYTLFDLVKALSVDNIVIYLRNPLEQEESGYNQRVKRHGEIRTFSLRSEYRSAVIDRLSEILDVLGDKMITVRPYGGFDESWDVVVDFFECLNIALSGRRKEIINKSYSYDALEFKRMLNFFDLGELNSDIDVFLQSYSRGAPSFSLLEAGLRDRVDSVIVREIHRLSKIYPETGLDGCFKKIKRQSFRPYMDQRIEKPNLNLIVKSLKSRELALYSRLSKLIAKQNYVAIPDPSLYLLFGTKEVESVSIVKDSTKSMIIKSRKRFSAKRHADYLRDRALLFEKEGHYKEALELMEAARGVRPTGPAILQSITRLREKIRREGIRYLYRKS